MRAEVTPKPELPGHAVLRVHDLNVAPDGLTICIERRQGPEKYLADSGWQRSESWLAPERIESFGGGIDFHVGPVVCDMVAGLTVRLSIKEPGVGNVGATVVPWPSMQTSGAYDPNRMVTGDTASGTDRGFATGSAPTTVVRLPEALMPRPAEPPPTQVQMPQPFVVPEQLPQQFQPAPEVPPAFHVPPQDQQMAPPFQYGGQQDQHGAPPFQFGGPPPDTSPATVFGQHLPSYETPVDRYEEVEKKGSVGKWIAIIFITIVVLVGAGGAAYWWFEPCGFCDLSKQVGLEICGRCVAPEPPVPERVLADRFLKTNPATAAMVEQCRAFRRDDKHTAGFFVCRAAAEAGDPVGAMEYATYYDPINQVPRSPVLPDAAVAVRYYEEAAKGDLPLALRRLGEIYAKGADNFPADRTKACEWLSKATDKGDTEAKTLFAELQCR